MIDINKKYQTKDGQEVRIYAVDGGGEFPVHGAVLSDEGWSKRDWTAKGIFVHKDIESGFDLIEVKKTKIVKGYRKIILRDSGSITTTADFQPSKDIFRSLWRYHTLIGDWEEISYEVEEN